MITLSIHEGHNASASIALNGHIIAAAAEERFLQKKNFMGFPYYAIKYCLDEVGVNSEEIDKVIMVTRHIDPLVVNISRSTDFSVQDHIRQQREYFARLHAGEDEVTVRKEYALSCTTHSIPSFYDFSTFDSYSTQFNDAERFLDIRKNAIVQHLNVPIERIELTDHHTCHAAYAYCASSFRNESTLVFTADCIGDDVSATVWLVDAGGTPKLLQRTKNQMLGYLWRYVTLVLGMIPLQHEYKIMGMAPYGNKYSLKVKGVLDKIEAIQHGEWMKPNKFGHYFEIRRLLEGWRFDQIAAGIQAHTENILSDWMRYWVEKTGVKVITFSGGLALNVKANTHLANQPWIEKFHIPPASSDESLPLGACYLNSLENANNWKTGIPLKNSYLGPNFDNKPLDTILEKYSNQDLKILDASPTEIAKLLAKGLTIGRCCGRMEFGPRALGNRSILARADKPEIKQKLNEQVKQRDWWMPFAPIVLQKNVSALFNINKELDGSFMTLCFDTTTEGKQELAAAIHPVDGSSRAQILKSGFNPSLENILLEYERQTGRKALLNTSFNLHGEPIVLNQEQALDTFLRSGLDCLLLHDTLIIKNKYESRLD